MFDIILAVDSNNGIGKNNTLQWKNSDELKIFKDKTQNSILIMGRKTVDSLPPLKNRTIFCVTNGPYTKFNHANNNVRYFSKVEYAISEATNENKKVFIAGGAKIYNYILKNYANKIDTVHVSIFNKEYDCDTFCYLNYHDYTVINKIDYSDFSHYEMTHGKTGERQYLDLIDDIVEHGEWIKDRVKYVFCRHLKFDLRNGFPLITTKKMSFERIIEAFILLLKGDSVDQLDQYVDQGIDQLEKVVNLLKNDKHVMITDFKPFNNGILHFYVQENNYLDMFCYNSSSNVGIGLPYTIAHIALLLHTFGKLLGIEPRYINLSLGDTQIYIDHIKELEEQTLRRPYTFPTLVISDEITKLSDIEKEHFLLTDYKFYPRPY